MTFTALRASGPASVLPSVPASVPPLLLLELELELPLELELLAVPLLEPLDDPLLLLPLELAPPESPLEEPPSMLAAAEPVDSLPVQTPSTHWPEMQSSSLMQGSPRLCAVSVHAAIAVARPTTRSVTMDAARMFERALMVHYDNKAGGWGPRKPLTAQSLASEWASVMWASCSPASASGPFSAASAASAALAASASAVASCPPSSGGVAP